MSVTSHRVATLRPKLASLRTLIVGQLEQLCSLQKVKTDRFEIPLAAACLLVDRADLDKPERHKVIGVNIGGNGNLCLYLENIISGLRETLWDWDDAISTDDLMVILEAAEDQVA